MPLAGAAVAPNPNPNPNPNPIPNLAARRRYGNMAAYYGYTNYGYSGNGYMATLH